MEVAGGGAAVVVGASSPRRVLVAVDESEESMHALSWCLSNVVSAAKAAAAPPPAVVLVHARSPRPFYCPSIDGAGYILTQQVMDSMDQYMASAADTVVTKAKSICTAFPNVRAHPPDWRQRPNYIGEGGDVRGEGRPARRDLRRRGEGRRRLAGDGQPRLRLPAEGAAGERQQPLRAQLQVPRRRRQEARQQAAAVARRQFCPRRLGSP